MHFPFDPFQRHRLLNGLDDIALTLEREPDIASFEASHEARVDTLALR
jgi:3-isopropylmalate dehydratase small subunit